MDARIAHETEPEFGSGLRKHLGKLNPPAEPAPELPPFGATAQAPRAGRPADWPEDLAQAADDLERREAMLAAAEAELFEREQHLADEAEALTAAAEAAQAQAQPPAEADAPAVEPEPPVENVEVRPAADVLRERLEPRIEIIWRAFEGALDAVGDDGQPDHKTRLQAARLLIAAAYPSERTSDDPMPAAAAELQSTEDELARLRDRRLEWGQSS
jgi:hypothetical protein